MKGLYRTLAVFVIVMPLHASAQDHQSNSGWGFSVGAGVLVAPSYLGDDDYQVLALPNIRITYSDRFFLSLQEGAGYNLINTGTWRIGPVIKYDFGRDEDGDNPVLISGNETNDLIGLGDVDGTVEVGGFVEYTYRPFTLKVELRQGINGHEGLIGETELQYRGATRILGKSLFYSIGPQMKFVDATYNNAFFGVNAAQSAASGLAQFKAEAGILSYGVNGSIVYSLTERVSAGLFANYSRLVGDAADSSLVQERGSEHQSVMGIFVNYRLR